jgi:lipid-binding SYLF domain-containing protein
LTAEVLTYSRAQGVFAGITLDGALIEQDNDSTRTIYGRDRSFRSILSGRITAPKSTRGFMKAITETSHAATLAGVRTDRK